MASERATTTIETHERITGFHKRPRIGSRIELRTSSRQGMAKVLGHVELKRGMTGMIISEPRSWKDRSPAGTRESNKITLGALRKLLAANGIK